MTYAGGPGVAHFNGTYKRWSYAPAVQAFVLVNGVDQNAFVLRLSAAEASVPEAVTREPVRRSERGRAR